MSRIIRGERHDPEGALRRRQQAISAVGQSQEFRVLTPYFPRAPGPGAGSPESDEGRLITYDELSSDLKQRIDTAGAAGIPVMDVYAVSVPGQVFFSLSQSPLVAAPVEVIINGVIYTRPTYFTLAGTLVTWSDVEFSLDIVDSKQNAQRRNNAGPHSILP